MTTQAARRLVLRILRSASRGMTIDGIATRANRTSPDEMRAIRSAVADLREDGTLLGRWLRGTPKPVYGLA